MLTIMCPNCRHRFPAPGCCNPGPQGTALSQNHQADCGDDGLVMHTSDCTNDGAFYGGGYLLVPRQYNDNNHGCFINAPTIIHGPTIIQQQANQQIPLMKKISDSRVPFTNDNLPWKITLEQHQNHSNCDALLKNLGNLVNEKSNDNENYRPGLDCHINTPCDLTGGTVTITTPSIQSGGCLIQSTDSGILVQAPRIEIRPKLTGGVCHVQKHSSIPNDDNNFLIYRDNERLNSIMENERFVTQAGNERFATQTRNDRFDSTGNERLEDCSNFNRILIPPSGCQELPGTRRCSTSMKINQQQQLHNVDELSIPKCNFSHRNVRNEIDCCRHNENNHEQTKQHQRQTSFCNSSIGSDTLKRNTSCCCANAPRNDVSCYGNITNSNRPISSSLSSNDDKTKTIISNESSNTGMEIRVNATVQLPPNIGHCTVNITATTGNTSNTDTRRISNGRTRNNFNGGGLVQIDANLMGSNGNETSLDRRDDAPTTPVSWLMPCPWGFDNYPMDKDMTRLAEIKRLLHTSGWYHEGLSWQQSETLLKNAPVGRWLMRDSSDSRFIFAVSVQTARGPTSVRVHYFLGRFRLDAEPRLSLAMPIFDCPIKMLEHYVDYSKRIDEHRKEVWVDYSGQLYSQIYLTKPLVKEVQTLSHLARLVVNSNKLSTDHLPPLMKNYLAEYPYSL